MERSNVKLYHRTRAGNQASQRGNTTLPPDYRVALGAVGEMTRFEEICGALPHRSRAEVAARLDDLEAIGLVECVDGDWLAALYGLAVYSAAQP